MGIALRRSRQCGTGKWSAFAGEKIMRKIDAISQQENCAPFMLDRPSMERAIAELVRFAAGVGLGGGDLIQMLDSGISMSEILAILEEKSKRRIQ